MVFSPRRAVWATACLLAVLYLAAFAGWLGPLTTCGADGATVCIAWPGIASAVTWLAFLAVIGGLGTAQALDWRHTSVARRELALLLLVLSAAFTERVWRFDLINVGYDESAAASLVAAWRLNGLFPLTGIVSSVGIPNPPGWPYLLATVLLWFDSPYAVIGLGLTTGLLAVLLAWWVARRWLGAWAALAAATFYAGGFWASYLGRGGWQPVFLQVPVILCLDALLILALRRQPWALVIACGWLGLMVQLHYIALVFAAMVPIAAWPARHHLRPVHVAAGVLTTALVLSPFLVYELNPMVRFRDFGLLAADTSGAASHWDLEAWNLLWTLAGNAGVAGLVGPDSDGLRQALGRWSNVGLIGIPLVACGLLAAVVGWPRGWRGGLIAAWVLTPAVGLAHHTLGIIFHYLYLGLPGMALAVGALAEWSVFRGGLAARWIIGGAVGVYVASSAATLWVVLEHVSRTGTYTGSARPIGLNMAAADAARAVLPRDGQVLIGGTLWEVEVLRFSLGYSVPSRVFDDCAPIPMSSPAIYLLNSERTPAARTLGAAGAPLLARVPRPDDAFLIYGEPTRPPVDSDTHGCA